MYNIKIEENKFRYCKFLLIDNDNHSRIFISEKNKYYTRVDNKSIHVRILNEFEDIRKYYGTKVIDITDNYYKINKPSIKHCTILLINDYNHSKIFISEKNLYYFSRADDDGNNFVNDDDFVNDYDIYDYDDDYHDDFFC